MNNLQTQIKNYLEYCKCQKRLDEKTLKAYRIDLEQFRTKITAENIMEITSDMLEDFIAGLHQSYKPKTVKRKIASVNDGSGLEGACRTCRRPCHIGQGQGAARLISLSEMSIEWL